MIQFIRNLFSVQDLRERILFTVVLAAVFRVGSFIPVPFIDANHLKELFSAAGSMSGVFGVADMFTGQAFSKMTIMALGVMPYISASLILQLMVVVVPSLEKMSKEGETGRKKITHYTRVGTLGLAILQSLGLALFLVREPKLVVPFMADYPVIFVLITMASITSGTVFLMWLGEKITERGIGNGMSMIIALGIMAYYPTQVRNAFQLMELGTISPGLLVIIAIKCVIATVLIILVQEGARKIPIQHAKQVVGRKMQSAQTNYLPLKVNTAGVMPVIFSMAVLTLPATIFGWVGSGGGGVGFIGDLFSQTSTYNLYNAFGIQKEAIFLILKAANLYTLSFFVLTMFFCFFYTAIVFNPRDVADNLRRVGAFVPGYRPGQQTADYIDKVMTRITLVGALFLCVIALLPQLLTVAFDVPWMVADFAGGTGLIIVVAVVLDTMKQIESRMLMRNYDGFKSRRQTGTGPRRWATSKGNAGA